MQFSKIAVMIAMGSSALLAQAPSADQAPRANAVRLDPPVPTGPPINSAPNPYRTVSGWFKVPEGRVFGSTGGVAVDQHNHIWVAERCGVKGFVAAPCAGST